MFHAGGGRAHLAVRKATKHFSRHGSFSEFSARTAVPAGIFRHIDAPRRPPGKRSPPTLVRSLPPLVISPALSMRSRGLDPGPP